jgi:hypothetical protein
MPKIILNSLYSRLFASVSDRSPNIRDRSPNFRDRSLNIRPHIPAARRGFFYFWPPAAHKKNVNF